MRFALEHQNPLRTGMVTGGDRLPADSYSPIRLEQGGDVLLWALKPADEGIEAGVVARLWNMAGEQRDFSLSLTPGIASARRVTHVETDLGDEPVRNGTLQSAVGQRQLSSYRLMPATQRQKGAQRP